MEKEQFDSWINEYASNNQFDVSMVPAHTHNRTDSLPVDFRNLANITRYILYRIVNPTVDTAVADIVGGDFDMPIKGTVMSVGATVDTAGVTNKMTIDINKNGVSILKTKITIDTATKTSRTALVPMIINETVNSFKVGDIFTFDVDVIQTTPAKGLTIFMNVLQILP